MHPLRSGPVTQFSDGCKKRYQFVVWAAFFLVVGVGVLLFFQLSTFLS